VRVPRMVDTEANTGYAARLFWQVHS